MVEMKHPEHLLLVDGHSLAYRAFYALPLDNFATSSGQPTNAVFGFTSMLINAIKDEKPTHLAIAFDVSRETFRKEMFPEYKANRAKSPDEFRSQLPLITEVIKAMQIPGIQVKGFEADDIIATLAKQGEKKGMRVSILTGDRDSYQLVNDSITVLYARKGVSDIARMTPQAVLDKYELTPAQYPDFAALRGDPSDNLPSVPSVGEKTAVKWIKEYGNLDELIKHADQISGKVGEALRANIDQVKLNRKMTELVKDVSLDISVDLLAVKGPDVDEVNKVFTELEFKSLRERLLGNSVVAKQSVKKSSASSFQVTTYKSGELKKWITTHAGEAIALDVQSEGFAQNITSIAWGLANSNSGIAFSDEELSAEDKNALIELLTDNSKQKIVHNAKDFYQIALSKKIEFKGLLADTEISAYLVNPGLRSYELEDVAMRVLGFVPELANENDGQLALGDDSLNVEGLAKRANAIYQLHFALMPQIEEKKLSKLLEELELPLVKVLAEMEVTGIAVDMNKLNNLSTEFEKLANGFEKDAFKIVGHEFNMGSPKQLQTVLFDERKLPKTKKTKTGFTTDAEGLMDLFAKTKDPVLSSILSWRDITKLKQTVVSLIPLAAKDNRIHTTFNQTVTSTGRLSSTEPNMQNIPIRTDQGKRIRDCFISAQDYECLLTADYSQIEMRIMAHLSKDPGLIEAFKSGEDLHTTSASLVFGVKPAEVDAELRRQIKAISYGLAYGMGAYGLSQSLDIEVGAAQKLMDEYFKRFGGVRDYLAEVVEVARKLGYTETIMGRRRYFPDLTNPDRQRREMAERMALNAPIQGSAADIVKNAMLNADALLKSEKLQSRLLLQVHDELVFEVAKGEKDQVEKLARTAMAKAASLLVPLDVSIGVGSSWDEAAH
ncbi:MAG: DNA polymerase I [Candidatus Nanopelagicales bacterium]|nr:DNA polymerase I [Candidatus Nanopelagicales bacterium]